MMSLFTDILDTEGFMMGKPSVVRVLGVMSLAGMLSACSSQEKGGDGDPFRPAGIPLDGTSNGNTTEVVTKMTPRSRYISKVKEQVSKKWNAYRMQRPNDVAFGSLEVDFSVNQQGKVGNIHVHNNEVSNPVLTRFTVQAIKDAEIHPMPANVISSLLVMEHGCLNLNYSAYHFPPREDRSTNPGRETTVKLTSTPLDRYYRQVTEQVEKKWNIYVKLRPGAMTAGHLQLVFYVNKRGKVEDLRIVNAKKSNLLLTGITLQAIKDAEIPPMPVDVLPLLPKNDPERLKIEYDALVY